VWGNYAIHAPGSVDPVLWIQGKVLQELVSLMHSKLNQLTDEKENWMKISIAHIALIVRDYDEAIDFYVNTLGFKLLEDTYQPEQDKRWVLVAPPGSAETSLLLAKASKPEQQRFIGNQTGGRVFLFLSTDDFWRDYHALCAKGVEFVREPKQAEYGIVSVFKDLYGNLWDLVQFASHQA